MDSKEKMPNSTVIGQEGKSKDIGVYADHEFVKVIDWEEYEQELARFYSLNSALDEAKQKKSQLQQKLESLVQVDAESLSRSNELDVMREQLQYRKVVMGNMSMHSKVGEEKSKKREEQLSSEIMSLLVAGTALSMSNKQLLEGSGAVASERGYTHLKNLQKLLRKRQQYMVSMISLLYPVKFVIGHSPEQELESFSSSIKSGVPAGSKPLDQGSLTIAGLHLTVIPFTKLNFFTDKKELQQSSTALGYVAHVVSLIASYLQFPLRYL